MDNMTFLIVVIVTVVLFLWIIQAVKMYPEYKRGIYKELYGNFLVYAWRVIALSDASEGALLKREIGKSYILFSKVQDNGKVAAKFCTIFYNKGLALVCFEGINGKIKGKIDDSHWIVTREDQKTGESKTYRHDSSYAACMTYKKRLEKQFPNVHLETIFAFGNQTDFSKLKSHIPCIHYEELCDYLKKCKAPYLPDEEITQLFKSVTGGGK